MLLLSIVADTTRATAGTTNKLAEAYAELRARLLTADVAAESFVDEQKLVNAALKANFATASDAARINGRLIDTYNDFVNPLRIHRARSRKNSGSRRYASVSERSSAQSRRFVKSSSGSELL